MEGRMPDTLYKRLGGYDAIAAVCDDLFPEGYLAALKQKSSRATAAKAASTRGSLTPPAALTCFTTARRMIFSVRARDPSCIWLVGRAQDRMAGAGGSRARFRSWSYRRVETGLTLSTLNVAEPRSRAIFTPLARSLRFLPAASPAAATDPGLPPVRRV